MKKLLLLFILICSVQANAQVRFDKTYTAVSPIIFSLMESHTDVDGNTYVLWIDNDA